VEIIRIIGKNILAFVRSPSKLTLKIKYETAILEYRIPEQQAKCKYSYTFVGAEQGLYLFLSLFDKKDQQICVLSLS